MRLLRRNHEAETFEDMVGGSRPVRIFDADLERLARLTSDLRKVEQAGPRPEFAAGLRERLMAEAATELQKAPVPLAPVQREGRKAKRVAFGSAAAILVVGVAGVSAASQQAGPGDALFPIKRGVETITGQHDASGDILAAADRDLSKLQSLLATGAADADLRSATGDFVSQAIAGTDAAAKSGSADEIAAAKRFTDRAETVLTQLVSDASADDQPLLAGALLQVRLLGQQLGDLG